MTSEPVKISIDDTLDLHHFNPKDISDLLNEYFSVCVEKKIYIVRIIHGKGTGALRDRVHVILKRHKNVGSFSPSASGNWGATIVYLVEPD